MSHIHQKILSLRLHTDSH